MSPKYKKILPEIMNVPGFTGVRIHSGNYASDSSGCLIVGKNTVKGGVTQSKVTMSKLMEKLKGQTNIEIEITQ